MLKLLRNPAARLSVQVGVSVGILWMLLRNAQWEVVWGVLTSGSPLLLVAAMAVKLLSLIIHEWRLWLALPQPRPALLKVISVGVVAGVLNLILPARGGDVAAIAMLDRDCSVPPPTSTAAIGVTSFLEAALFAAFLMAVLGLGAAQWTEITGSEQNPVLWIAGALGLGVAGLTTIAAVGRRLRERPVPSSSILALIRQTFVQIAGMVGSSRYLFVHSIAAVLQVVMVVASFSIALVAVTSTVDAPITAASMVLAASSLAAFVLPPTMAAGPAAACSLVLPHFGVDAAGALAYATVYWAVAHLPALGLGLPAIFARR